ncbi:MAG: DUF1990 domain-containing protein [Acidobacteriota bacterium]|nr:DUF1990 domain-containing protein [Acidobacteriota bacterium]
MFRFSPYPDAKVEKHLQVAAQLPPAPLRFLTISGYILADPPPIGFVRNTSQSQLGAGPQVWNAARKAMASWIPFDLGWVSVRNAQAPIQLDELVAVEAHTLNLWSLNISRIVNVIDTSTQFGFVYATTPLHVEDGEERFFLEFDPETGRVTYSIQAVSRPRSWLARLGYPVTRAYQHRFARHSHQHLRGIINSANSSTID